MRFVYLMQYFQSDYKHKLRCGIYNIITGRRPDAVCTVQSDDKHIRPDAVFTV
jgi:hypothetical protein